MHPGFFGWWRGRGQGGGCGGEASCGPSGWGHGHGHEHGHEHGWHGWHASGDDEGGAPFGVRRPLRFLAYKLELDEEQVAELARVLADLKTERAQAAVDNRRSVTALADIIAGEAFDPAKASEAAAQRAKSAERVNEAVAKALGRIHATLRADQRSRLAYLIRTGALTI
jgi:hypothetical protein